MGEHKSGPYPNKKTSIFEQGVLYICQIYICLTGFLKETLQDICAATSRANKSGHHGCTPKQVWLLTFL